METVLGLLKNRDYKLDLDITVPASQLEEFSRQHKKWSYTKKGDSTVFYPNTIGTRGARRIIRSLPDYATVSKVSIFTPDDPNVRRFYHGPFNVPAEKVEDFLISRVEADIKECKGNMKEISTKVKFLLNLYPLFS